jgi:hypothetical protein
VQDDTVAAAARAAQALVRVKEFSIDTALTSLTELLNTICAS